MPVVSYFGEDDGWTGCRRFEHRRSHRWPDSGHLHTRHVQRDRERIGNLCRYDRRFMYLFVVDFRRAKTASVEAAGFG